MERTHHGLAPARTLAATKIGTRFDFRCGDATGMAELVQQNRNPRLVGEQDEALSADPRAQELPALIGRTGDQPADADQP